MKTAAFISEGLVGNFGDNEKLTTVGEDGAKLRFTNGKYMVNIWFICIYICVISIWLNLGNIYICVQHQMCGD